MNNSSSTEKQDAGDGGESGEDQLNRLPDELFILILTKLPQPHFKFLCQCSLVSKRFASSIPQMPTVSITIPYPKLDDDCDSDFCVNAPQTFEDFMDRLMDRKRKSLELLRPQVDKALGFLEKFKEIRSLDVVLVGSDGVDCGVSMLSFLGWKTRFDFNLQSFAFLFAQSLLRKKVEEEEEEDVEQISDEQNLRVYWAIYCAIDPFAWRSVLFLFLVQHHPMLHNITITGPEKGGKLCLRDDELLGLRNSLTPEYMLIIRESKLLTTPNVSYEAKFQLKSGYVPVLSLPLSGYIMKDVSLVIIRVERTLSEGIGDSIGDDGDECDYDDNDIIAWDFEEEEKVFGEAVTSILMNHKDKMLY